MIDPYQVLGISPGATKEEIKKAYRSKAKLYHPDLHPDDPQAAARMNEVNEAYDMLQNPEKYEAKRAQEERNRQARQNAQSSYGGYGQGNPFGGSYGGYGQGGYYGGQYRQNGSQQSQQGNYYQQGNHYQGNNGWYSDFGGFGFEDLFGFGFGQQYDTTPHPQSGDSPQLAQAILHVNSGRFQEAIDLLSAMTSQCRNDRWYYVSSIAYRGIGDLVRAQDQIQKALQLNPESMIYKQLYRTYAQENQAQSMYENQGSRTHSPFSFFTRIILFIIIMRLVFTLMSMMMYSGLPMH